MTALCDHISSAANISYFSNEERLRKSIFFASKAWHPTGARTAFHVVHCLVTVLARPIKPNQALKRHSGAVAEQRIGRQYYMSANGCPLACMSARDLGSVAAQNCMTFASILLALPSYNSPVRPISSSPSLETSSKLHRLQTPAFSYPHIIYL